MKNSSIYIIIFVFLFMVNQISPIAFAKNNKTIMGWLEKVVILPYKIELTAKLDSGADRSSIHARNIEIFEKDGAKWVSFTLEYKNKNNIVHQIQVEKPLVRKVHIKRHAAKSVERAVVSFDFYLGGKKESAEFTLANRGNFKYPVLLGRQFLKKNIVIDPEKTFLISSDPGSLKNNKLGNKRDRQ